MDDLEREMDAIEATIEHPRRAWVLSMRMSLRHLLQMLDAMLLWSEVTRHQERYDVAYRLLGWALKTHRRVRRLLERVGYDPDTRQLTIFEREYRRAEHVRVALAQLAELCEAKDPTPHPRWPRVAVGLGRSEEPEGEEA